MGRNNTETNSIGASNSLFPIANVNGVRHFLKSLNSINDRNYVVLPPAPTVLPYDAVLTTEQIAMGVIKHADSSNSGLIVNGKFDTDTSGWSVRKTSILSVASNRLNVNAIGVVDDLLIQPFAVIAGKTYIIELEKIQGNNVRISVGNSNSNYNGEQYLGLDNLANGKYIVNFTANVTGTVYLKIKVNNSVGIFDNIAVYPADAISRSDLVFLETWHEDLSEKDFVYPLGNVQYLGGVTDGMSAIVAGAFSGSGTYSLFGNWQASGALVGKGYVWSTMTDAQKKAFVSNPENNCYLDGDKVIQVRYRVRVVAGLGDSWLNVDANSSNGSLSYSTTADVHVLSKGKNTSISYDVGQSNLERFYNPLDTRVTWSVKGDIGSFTAMTNLTTPTSKAYEGKCYALPIALVHRRNQYGYDATYNPNGTRTMTMTPTCIADCFNPSNYNALTGYIGTSTSRPDGLFYDQVSVEDFKPANKGVDLRATSKKRTAQSLIEEFAPKVIAGTLLYNNNDTTALTTYKDHMEVRDTSGNRYSMKNKIGNVVTINDTVANKKGFSIVTQNGKQWLQVADDAASDATVQMNLSTIKYDLGVFDA